MAAMRGKIARFVIYGLMGMCFEVFWSAIYFRVTGLANNWNLTGHTYLCMFPIYGLVSPLYEPIHNKVRRWFWVFRAAIYAAGFMIAEYVTGGLIYLLTGHCPWDYSPWCKYHIQGFVRLDIFWVWATVGMLLEPTHDFLVRLMPAILKEIHSPDKA
jgi:hypothetical protein